MEIGLKYKGKKINLQVKKLGVFGRFIGLMFSRRENARALLFDFKKPTRTPIHSFFVFYPFIAVWLNKNWKIQELRVVNPFLPCIKPKKPFCRLVEIPLNSQYQKVLEHLFGTFGLQE